MLPNDRLRLIFGVFCLSMQVFPELRDRLCKLFLSDNLKFSERLLKISGRFNSTLDRHVMV
jgi:hypothetical protein